MKKVISAASLVLRLTWAQVAGLFAVIGAGQWLAFLLSEHARDPDYAFENRLDDLPALLGRLGFILLMLVLYFTLQGGKNSKISYTLRRLSISESSLTAVWALVCAGYFLMFWLYQLAMVLALYFRFAAETGRGSENLLFVAAYRSRYFHTLLPLAEPWGYVRNGFLALGYGNCAALGARNARNGRPAAFCVATVLIGLTTFLIPYEMASVQQDITFTVLIVLGIAWDWSWTRGWMRNEAN